MDDSINDRYRDDTARHGTLTVYKNYFNITLILKGTTLSLCKSMYIFNGLIENLRFFFLYLLSALKSLKINSSVD